MFVGTKLGSIVVVIALAVSAVCVPSSTASKRKKYKKEVPLGGVRVHFDEVCVLFSASLSSGDFFHNLESIETPRGREFAKAKQEELSFPEQLSVHLIAVVNYCEPRPNSFPPLALEADRMRTLKYSAQWERDSQIQIINEIRTQKIGPPNEELGNVWEYLLTFSAKDVPLTDKLTVVIESATGEELARISGGL